MADTDDGIGATPMTPEPISAAAGTPYWLKDGTLTATSMCANCGYVISSYWYANVGHHWMHDGTHRSECFPIISARPTTVTPVIASQQPVHNEVVS